MAQRWAIVVVVGLALLAACEDEPGPATTTVTSPTTSPTTPPTTPPTIPPTTPPTTSTATTRPAPGVTTPPLSGLAYTPVADAPFPIMVTARPGDSFALVGMRGGVVRVLGEGGLGPEVVDISRLTTTDGERGLLGLARHPGAEGRLFLHYTDLAGDTVVSEMAFDGRVADAGSERVLVRVDQPAANHNGGMIQFGPDGALYLGLGDGGGAGDRYGNAQNTDTLLGGLVRVDVDSGEALLWHRGLRNPWRFWIDGGEIWIADVGQGAYEEIDLADVGSPGVNYGWPLMEGAHCYSVDPCRDPDLTLPLVEIERGDGGSCAVTGGVVYRGGTIPELDGRYLFSDYCGGYLRSVDADGRVEDHTDAVGALPGVVSFGVDGAGEVYVLTTERILRLDPVR